MNQYHDSEIHCMIYEAYQELKNLKVIVDEFIKDDQILLTLNLPLLFMLGYSLIFTYTHGPTFIKNADIMYQNDLIVFNSNIIPLTSLSSYTLINIKCGDFFSK